MKAITFVNISGDPVSTSLAGRAAPKRAKSAGPDKFHKGWRVVGFPAGALEEAEKSHAEEIAAVREHNERHPKNKKKEPKALDAERWLATARKSAIRSKPYELREAADVCAELARKGGRLAVEIRAISKGEDGA